MERDIIPMCRSFGMAIGKSTALSHIGADATSAPWGVLGAGKFKDPEELKARAKEGTLRGDLEASEREIKVAQALKEVANEIGGGVALANSTSRPRRPCLSIHHALPHPTAAFSFAAPVSDSIEVALAWCRQTVSDCYPIIGGTKLGHLQSNIEALKIRLTSQQLEKLSNAVPFDWGFPYSMFGTDAHYLPDGKPQAPLINHVCLSSCQG
jgi:hypothetical protein